MTKTARRVLAPSLALLLAVVLPPPGAAEDLPVSAFFGRFQGSGIAENQDSLYFGVTVRDLDVRIGPDGNGFYVEWTSVIRSGGDPNNPDVRRKTTRVSFAPSERQGIFEAGDGADPIAGGELAWASVSNNTLIVNTLFIREDGGYEMQSYERTLDVGGMDLNFVRIRDGEPVRRVEAQLVKVAN